MPNLTQNQLCFMQQKDIKPEIYRDEQVKSAIQELFSYQDFLDGMKAFVPVQLNKLILEEIDHVKSAHDFQKNVIRPFLKVVKKSTISDLTISGLEHLKANETYLFISNHRDIVLDSAFLNMVLLENGMQTSQIAIGDNLVANRLTELIFKMVPNSSWIPNGQPVHKIRAWGSSTANPSGGKLVDS